MKIEARNAYSYIQHIKLLAYLSGKEEAEEVQKYAYSVTGEEVYQKLCRIEAKAHRQQERECNGETTEEQAQKADERTRKQVAELLPRLESLRLKFYINGDPRGYTLKIDAADQPRLIALGFSTYTDFGGCIILAPEF